MQSDVKNLVKKINRRKLTNNTQRALFALLTSKTEWVPRTAINVPSVGARLRDLRKPQFGQFVIRCATANKLERKSRKAAATTRQTFYRLEPASVTVRKVQRVFEGVIDAK